METSGKFLSEKFGRRTWIKFDIDPSIKKKFKKKCKEKGFDMSTYLKYKINEFLMEGNK